MKKNMIYTFLLVLLLISLVAGATYSYLVSSIGDPRTVATNASKYEVIYTGGTEISGIMPVTADKTDAFKTDVNIKLGKDSATALADLYINIEEMTDNLSIEGFVWEVYGYKNGNQVKHTSGNFKGYNAQTNKILTIIDDYELSEENTKFTVYLWLDGNKTDNAIIGASFKGYIGAKTEYLTGKLS